MPKIQQMKHTQTIAIPIETAELMRLTQGDEILFEPNVKEDCIVLHIRRVPKNKKGEKV